MTRWITPGEERGCGRNHGFLGSEFGLKGSFSTVEGIWGVVRGISETQSCSAGLLCPQHQFPTNQLFRDNGSERDA